MKKTRFVNNKRVLRNSQIFHSETSVSSVIPNRAYTEAELAYRLQTGQPLPTLTMYRTYEDNGLNKPFVAKDLISATELATLLESNLDLKQQLLNKQININKSFLSFFFFLSLFPHIEESPHNLLLLFCPLLPPLKGGAGVELYQVRE